MDRCVVFVGSDVPRELRGGVSCDRPKELSQQTTVSSSESRVGELHESGARPLRPLSLRAAFLDAGNADGIEKLLNVIYRANM